MTGQDMEYLPVSQEQVVSVTSTREDILPLRDPETGRLGVPLECLLVVDAEGKLFGIVSPADLNRPQNCDGRTPLRDICNRAPRTLTALTDATEEELWQEALRRLDTPGSITYLPVTNEDNIPKGFFHIRENTNAFNRKKAFRKEYWTKDYTNEGEEWSTPWGNYSAQWYGSLYPRTARFLPAESILEIAPGQGRWSRFIIPMAKRYVGVDINEYCVQSCKDRFSGFPHAEFYRNDGLTFPMITEGCVDFIFSFDSLVHVDLPVMESYIKECLRVLKPNGSAFLHHSNAGEFPPESRAAQIAKRCYRAMDVTADAVKASIETGGGVPILQERINWQNDACTDCITLFVKKTTGNPVLQTIQNDRFMLEAELIRDSVAAYWKA